MGRVSGLLYGEKEVSEYLNNASGYLLRKWLAIGMPVLIHEGRWMAHTENLEDFFKALTRKRVNVKELEECDQDSIVEQNQAYGR